MTVSPCKDCQNHTAECHANCTEYANWRAEKDRENAMIERKKTLEADLNNFRSRCISETMKRGRLRRRTQ